MKTTRYLVSAAALLLRPACSTAKGMGQDLQKAGKKIESAAKK